MDPYFNRSEVSNSDLTVLKKLLYGGSDIDPTYAYAFGTLIDAMITEAHKVDYFKRTVTGQNYIYSTEDFQKASEMKKAYYRDAFCKMITNAADFQSVSIQHNWPIEYNGFEFELNVRCKWDLLVRSWKMGADIKSTAAETQSQFEAACEYFDYFRSRAWYMDIEGTNKDMIIGISKKNFKVFKIPINRGDKYYKKGKEEYQDLSFKYWSLFDGLKISA